MKYKQYDVDNLYNLWEFSATYSLYWAIHNMKYHQDTTDTIDAIDSLCEHPYNRSLYRTLRGCVSDQLYTMLSSLLYMRGQITMRGEI